MCSITNSSTTNSSTSNTVTGITGTQVTSSNRCHLAPGTSDTGDNSMTSISNTATSIIITGINNITANITVTINIANIIIVTTSDGITNDTISYTIAITNINNNKITQIK